MPEEFFNIIAGTHLDPTLADGGFSIAMPRRSG